MQILFHEQAVCRRGTKMEKGLLDEFRQYSCVALLISGTSLLFEESKQIVV